MRKRPPVVMLGPEGYTQNHDGLCTALFVDVGQEMPPQPRAWDAEAKRWVAVELPCKLGVPARQAPPARRTITQPSTTPAKKAWWEP